MGFVEIFLASFRTACAPLGKFASTTIRWSSISMMMLFEWWNFF